MSSARLPQEFALAKLRQDRQLEGIEKGLGTLREVASAMGEALEHQDVLVDAITEKVSALAVQLLGSLIAHLSGARWSTRSTADSLHNRILIDINGAGQSG